MAYIQVLPEFGLVADPMIGIITSAGESLSPVIEKVAILEATSDDLVNMLSGEGNLLASFPEQGERTCNRWQYQLVLVRSCSWTTHCRNHRIPV